MAYSIHEIQNDLKNLQSADRYEHTISVMYTAAALCMNYGLNIHQGMLAGLLHDCGKLAGKTDYIAECNKYGIEISEDSARAPHLLHGALGVYYAKNKYHIYDEEVLSAIECHTTGKPHMTLLEKIIFIADYIEPHREKSPNLEYLRKLAFENIDACLILVLKQMLDFLKAKNYFIGQATVETYRFYKNLLELKGETHE